MADEAYYEGHNKMHKNIKSWSTASVQLSAYEHWLQTHKRTP